MIKKILSDVFGISIYRTSRKKQHKFSNHDRPIHIEFVGVSGVGKSTLFHELKKNKKSWIEVREFMQMNRTVNTNTLLDNSTLYQKIADYRLQSVLQQNIAPADKFRVIHWGYTTLIEDAVINRFNTNATIISEEGLFHNFGKSIEHLYRTERNMFNEIIKRRAIIYCYAPPDIIAKQIINRKKETGRIVAHHKEKLFEELITLQQEDLKEKEQFINLLKEHNIPVLMISTVNNIQNNCKEINSFIEKLQKDN